MKNKKYLQIYHAIYLAIVTYITAQTVMHISYLPLAVLCLTFVFHWWIGTLVFLNLPKKKHLNTKLANTLYLLIFVSMTTGTMFFYDYRVFFLLYGLSFIYVIPLYHMMLRNKDADKDHDWFISKKYFLEYLGGIGFLSSILIIRLEVLPANFVIYSCALLHITILLYLFNKNNYPRILRHLEISLR